MWKSQQFLLSERMHSAFNSTQCLIAAFMCSRPRRLSTNRPKINRCSSASARCVLFGNKLRHRNITHGLGWLCLQEGSLQHRQDLPPLQRLWSTAKEWRRKKQREESPSDSPLRGHNLLFDSFHL